MILDGKVVLVTGGTGSFGKAFTKAVLKSNLKKLIIFSRDELKQSEMAQDVTDPRIRFFIGDVRDRDRLYRALDGVDVVVHAAALKQVPACEYNPIEAIRTNVDGAANLIDAAIDRKVRKVIALSTDKAVNPVNLYGATKLCSDKLFTAANYYSGTHSTRFSVVRYGNVVGSRGSVIPLFQKCRAEGKPLPVTDFAMTRFWITMEQAVAFVLKTIDRAVGGGIWVPKIPSSSILRLVEAIDPISSVKVTGIRPGEKLHETLIADTEVGWEFDDHFVITGPGGPDYEQIGPYRSDTNPQQLSVEELRGLIAGVL